MFLKISLYIGRIRIQNDNTRSVSGSEENIPDPYPDPQPWIICTLCIGLQGGDGAGYLWVDGGRGGGGDRLGGAVRSQEHARQAGDHYIYIHMLFL